MSSIEKLLEVMAKLRDRETGCPWDLEQDFASIAPYTVEEAYEVADSIARGDLPALCGELGDLLLQVVFHARMAEEAGAFDFEDVAAGITAKMIRRHPHVFGTAGERGRGAVAGSWERIKAEERQAAAGGGAPGTLDGIAQALPALKRAQKLGRRAAGAGFDWPEDEGPRLKVLEELKELEEARRDGSATRTTEELGDLLFAVVNLARHLDVDAEQALSDANRKFERRFRRMEEAVAAAGRDLRELPIAVLEEYWQGAKRQERD
ncbi:MAG TPA: nucleoside triphosphate pyrophosphohydrolase [Woeseiaceae bacterium]|nr:nucleoside triphosphate pyrophosphohydrolase [Woeseiaceae bacterium]